MKNIETHSLLLKVLDSGYFEVCQYGLGWLIFLTDLWNADIQEVLRPRLDCHVSK